MDKSDINNLQAFSGEYLVINQAILGKFLRDETSITLCLIFDYICSYKMTQNIKNRFFSFINVHPNYTFFSEISFSYFIISINLLEVLKATAFFLIFLFLDIYKTVIY